MFEYTWFQEGKLLVQFAKVQSFTKLPYRKFIQFILSRVVKFLVLT